MKTMFGIALVSLSLGFATMGCSAHHAHPQTAKQADPPPPAPPPPVEKAAIVDDKIVLPGELEFEVNRATIKTTEQSTAILTELADIMKKNKKITKLRIEGHTDNTGSAKKNQRLSQARAEAVAKWLVAHEIDKSRLMTVGLGDKRPVVDNDTPEHRVQNRRTEFHIAQLDGKAVGEDGAAPARVASN